MADRPMLFSGPMVRALLAGSKTQTRRVLKPQPQGDVIRYGWSAAEGASWTDRDWNSHPLRIWAGDRIWVRETWHPDPNGVEDDGTISVTYRADRHHAFGLRPAGNWKLPIAAQYGGVPGIHMPRWASRLTLTVTDVRVERLQDISEEDAKAEGIYWSDLFEGWTSGAGADESCDYHGSRPDVAYRKLWERINGEGSWDANPWVAAYTFTVERRNIDGPPAP